MALAGAIVTVLSGEAEDVAVMELAASGASPADGGCFRPEASATSASPADGVRLRPEGPASGGTAEGSGVRGGKDGHGATGSSGRGEGIPGAGKGNGFSEGKGKGSSER
jgi:hypothetical protein